LALAAAEATLPQRAREGRSCNDGSGGERKSAPSSARASDPPSPLIAASADEARFFGSRSDEEDKEGKETMHALKAAAEASQSASATMTTPLPATQLPFLPQSALLQRLTCKPSPVPIPPNSIGLTYLHEFLSPKECAELIALSQGQFARSTVGYGSISSKRTSNSAGLGAGIPLVRRIRQRITEFTGASDGRIEEPSVVRYEVGQQYRPHFDSSLDGHHREFTLFVYLNTLPAPDAGGETEFTKLGVKFTPKEGDALFWRNHKDRDSPHFQDGRHAGRPPLSGVKYGQSRSSQRGACACQEASMRL
jgi:prolyl 4-hydroxylase